MENDINEMRKIIALKLEKEGCTGLKFEGECACALDDLMPCGVAEVDEDGEDYVNGCDSGHKHIDPENEKFWVVSSSKEPPSAEKWAEMRAHYL